MCLYYNTQTNLGGPLSCYIKIFHSYFLIGFRVKATSCELQHQPNIYIKVHTYFYWIEKVMNVSLIWNQAGFMQPSSRKRLYSMFMSGVSYFAYEFFYAYKRVSSSLSFEIHTLHTRSYCTWTLLMLTYIQRIGLATCSFRHMKFRILWPLMDKAEFSLMLYDESWCAGMAFLHFIFLGFWFLWFNINIQ